MTVLQYLKTLPKEIREKAIANYDQEFVNRWCPEDNPSNLAIALYNAFDWGKSSESNEFWATEYRSLIDFVRNNPLIGTVTTVNINGKNYFVKILDEDEPAFDPNLD